jgi:hypothetical protein
MPCATIKTRTVGIITAINSTEDCDFLRSLVDRAMRTSVRHHQCVDGDVDRADSAAD